MGYVEKNLLPSEEIVYKAKIHWSIYISGYILIIIGLIIIGLTFLIKENINILNFNNMLSAGVIDFIIKYWITPYILGAIFIFTGSIKLIKAFILKISTELVVTTKRVIAKFGFIKRKTIELNHSKVESFIVNQNIFQRIFDSGTIIVQGTGGGKTPIPNIDSPLEFRSNAMEIVDRN